MFTQLNSIETSEIARSLGASQLSDIMGCLRNPLGYWPSPGVRGWVEAISCVGMGIQGRDPGMRFRYGDFRRQKVRGRKRKWTPRRQQEIVPGRRLAKAIFG